MNSGFDELLGYRFRAYATTDVGPRGTNQDRFLLDTFGDWKVLAVADGMGGGQFGAEAAEIAMKAIRNQASGCTKVDGQHKLQCVNVVAESVELAHQQVYELGETNKCASGEVGTTLTSLTITPDLTTCIVTHVGDSRAYLYSRARGFVPITEDHAIGNRLTRAITNDTHFARNPDVGDFYIDSNEATVLGIMTDGLWCSAGEKRLGKSFRMIASHPENISQIVCDLFTESLVNATDNCTAIFAVIESESVNYAGRRHFGFTLPFRMPWMN
jgi:serine/threonine protein phosphatase PrpC